MNPINDVICSLIQTPFSQWKDDDQKDLLQYGRPTISLSVKVKKEIKKTNKSYIIKFKNSWFTEYKWLCSSPYLERVFCWPCLLFCRKNNVWVKDGYSDFINISRSFHKHGDSGQHLKCQLQLKIFEKNRRINTSTDALTENASLMKVKFNEKVHLNRLLMQLVIDAVIYLGKQELSFREHERSCSSLKSANFRELMSLLIASSSLEIQTHYSKMKGVFSDETILNEVIECISEYMKEHIKYEVKKSLFFSIQVDNGTNITQKSQCSVIIRYVNSEAILVERFLGFHDVSSSRTSEKMFDFIDELLTEFAYEHKMVAQCYDGACVMPEHLNDLQKIIKDKAPQAVLVHSLAHRLNLVLQQCCEQISKCRIFFANIAGFLSFFRHSTKRARANGLRTAVATCWSPNTNVFSVIVEDWNNLKNVLEVSMMDKDLDEETVQLSSGLLNQMNNFEFIFLAVVFNDIFNLTEVLSDILQDKPLEIDCCVLKINSTREIIQDKRNEYFFQKVFEKAKEITPVSQKRNEKHLTDEEIFQNYRDLFYEILDIISVQIEVRFQDSEKLQFLDLVNTSNFLRYLADFPNAALADLQKAYPQIFKKQNRLKNELLLFYSEEMYRDMPIEKLLLVLQENKDIFQETHKLFSLVLTIPSSSAPVERSCLKRIKTYTKNRISQEKLSSLANIAIQKELLEDLLKKKPFYEDVINKFAALKDRTIELIYKN